jgi:hypothetical protein
MAGSKTKIRKYLKVEQNKIYTKIPARIFLDLSEYKSLNEQYAEKLGVEEIDNVFKLPGFFTIEFPEENDSIDFFFPYTVYITKTADTTITKDSLEILFEPDDLIVYGNFKDSDTDIGILSSLFQNGAKYLGNKPDKLIQAIWQQLLFSANVPVQHIEILVSQLYATYDKSKKQVVPLRLTNLSYNKKHIMNIKQSAHNLNNALGFTYGYSKESLRTSVSKKKKGKNSFFEDIMGSNYDALVERSNIEKKEKTDE